MPVSETQNIYIEKAYAIDNTTHYAMVLSEQHQTDSEKDVKQKTTYDSYDNYLNILTSSQKIYEDDVLKQCIDSRNDYEPLTSPWLPARCTTSVSVQYRPSESYFINQSDFEYYTNGSLYKVTTDKAKSSALPDPIQISSSSDKKIEVSYLYDSFGNVTKETTKVLNDPDVPADKIERFIERGYTDDGLQLQWEQNQLGADHRKTYQYNATSGQLELVTAPNGLTGRYYYDDYLRLEKTVAEDNTESISRLYWVTSTTEDDPANALFYSYESASVSGYKITFYDKYKRVLRSVSLAPDNEKLYVDVTYNNVGQVWKKSLPYKTTETPRWIEYAYDDKGRQERIEYPDGKYIEWSYNGLVTTTTTGKVINGTDTPDEEKEVTVNAMGEAVKSKTIKGDASADKAVIYAYDSQGKVKSTSIEGVTGTETLFEYD